MTLHRLLFNDGLCDVHRSCSKNKIVYCNSLWSMISGSVTSAWCVLGLRMEEQPPVWRVAAKYIESAVVDSQQGVSFSLEVGQGDNNSP